MHKDDEMHFTGRDVQVDAIKKLKRQVLGCIADDFTVFISHTGKDAMEAKVEGIVCFYDETCVSTGIIWSNVSPLRSKAVLCLLRSCHLRTFSATDVCSG